MTEKQKTASFWSANDSYAAPTYYRLGPVIDRYAKKVFGVTADGRADWLEHLLAEKTFPGQIPFPRVLSLCCGFGHVERALARVNFGTEIHGIDLSRAALDQASVAAQNEGLNNISYSCQDINELILGENEWDVIYVSGGLHHLKKVNKVVATISSGLRPEGYFIAYDRIGPEYHYPSRTNQEVINAVMHLMPVEFRPQFKIKGHKSLPGIFEDLAKMIINRLNKRTSFGRVYFPPPPFYMKRIDPSEGIGSELVYSSIMHEFPDCEFFPLNGGLLSYLIGAGFLKCYDAANKSHVSFLESLFALEDSLTELGRIRCIDAVFICQKKRQKPA